MALTRGKNNSKATVQLMASEHSTVISVQPVTDSEFHTIKEAKKRAPITSERIMGYEMS